MHTFKMSVKLKAQGAREKLWTEIKQTSLSLFQWIVDRIQILLYRSTKIDRKITKSNLYPLLWAIINKIISKVSHYVSSCSTQSMTATNFGILSFMMYEIKKKKKDCVLGCKFSHSVREILQHFLRNLEK